MTLSTQRVEDIFVDCLFKDGEDTSTAVMTQGIVHNAGFHPERLEAHRQDVEELLAELPTEFHMSTGGGWSFLNMCMTKDGEQWTGFHQSQEQLMLLGIALGKMKYLLPKEFWPALPGGVPYVAITD